MSIYRERLCNTSNALSPRVSSKQIRLQVPLNCSESTAGSLRQLGSEFQTVVPATEKARVPEALYNGLVSVYQRLMLSTSRCTTDNYR